MIYLNATILKGRSVSKLSICDEFDDSSECCHKPQERSEYIV